LQAQQSGTITGTVVDQVGKPIPQASVEVRNESAGASKTGTADDDGKYSIADLPATSTVSFAASPGDQLNLLPGRSVTVTFSLGYAPKK